MIEINLRPGLKRKRAGASPLAALGDRFKALGSTVKDPMMLLAGGAWAVALLFLVGTWLVGQRQLSVLEPKLVETRAEHERFRNFVAAKRREELIRDSVLSQISTIRQVDGERYIWAHVLDEVARALPAYTWLTNVSAQPQVIVAADTAGGAVPVRRTDVLIEGRTVDIQAYTRFLRELEASPWLTGVTALSAETVVEKERAVTAFGIRATFERADSAYIRTVPLSESVR
jgi:Tfp pilus assembly protein PilN